MHPDARTPLKDFDGGRRQPHVQRLVGQAIRHGVQMVIDLDMVIDVHAGLAPLGVHERSAGNGRSAGQSNRSNKSRRDTPP
jgi:hypothetical protein